MRTRIERGGKRETRGLEPAGKKIGTGKKGM